METRELIIRKRPCLCVICKCGSVFAASIMDVNLPFDEEFWNDLVDYAKKGYRIEVRDSSEFKMDRCKCDDICTIE